jgi:hypothetical protein
MCCCATIAYGHNPRFDPPEPKSVPEAWNVIRQCISNVGTLLDTNQLDEIAYQVANCSPSIRVLQAHLSELPDGASLNVPLNALFGAGGGIILATRERAKPREKAIQAYHAYQSALNEIEAHYPPSVVNAEVYICPMHPLDRHLDPADRCSICSMALVRRRISASTVYEKPGEPSMKLVAMPDHTLKVGQETNVRVRIARNDGRPVTLDDLLVIHTQKIHLLIVDRSLNDYHHIHPSPTATPGEYAFTFTPRRPGPYRIWADVVPGWSSIQEYLIADLRSGEAGDSVDRSQTSLSASVEGLTYSLTFNTRGGPLRVGEVVIGRIDVTGPDGKPFVGLEPIMGAFAHIVGFNEDYKTVVHIHPMGNEPLRPTDRGGPVLEFKYYPPAAGFTRLYCQVNIGGDSKFAPFGINVLPAEQRE